MDNEVPITGVPMGPPDTVGSRQAVLPMTITSEQPLLQAHLLPHQQQLPQLAPGMQQQQYQQQPALLQALQQQQQQQPTAVNVVPAVPRQPLPKQLTAAIKSASSVERLMQLFNDHSALLNPIHVAAMITKLPKLEATVSVSQLSAASGAGAAAAAAAAASASASTTPVGGGGGGELLLWLQPSVPASHALLAQLLAKIKHHNMDEYSPRGLANIVWALAKLQHYPDPELRALLLDTFVDRLPLAVPQDVSNVLWGVAKLTKERSSGLTPLTTSTSLRSSGGASSSAQQGPCEAGDPHAAQGSNGEGGLAHPAAVDGTYPAASEPVSDVEAPPMQQQQQQQQQQQPAPVSLSAAPLLTLSQSQQLLTHLCNHLQRATVQTISNSLWAVVVLQHEHGWCMCGSLVQVQLLLHAFCQQPREALPGHIQPVIRCMSQLAAACAAHNGDAWLVWQPPVLQRLLGHLFVQRSQMEQHHVSSVLRDIAQLACLLMLLQRRKLEAAAAAEGKAPLGPVPAEEMLRVLASTTGLPDTTGTMLALGMLRPQLAEMGLLPSVQHLCSMLSVVSSHNQADLDNRLTAAAVMIGAVAHGSDANLALGLDPMAAGPTAYALLTMSAAAAAATAGHGAGGGAAAAAAAIQAAQHQQHHQQQQLHHHHQQQQQGQQAHKGMVPASLQEQPQPSPSLSLPRSGPLEAPLHAQLSQQLLQQLPPAQQGGAPAPAAAAELIPDDVFAVAAQQAKDALAAAGGIGAGAGTTSTSGPLLSAPTAAAGSLGSSSSGSGGLPASVEAAAAALRDRLALSDQTQQPQTAQAVLQQQQQQQPHQHHQNQQQQQQQQQLLPQAAAAAPGTPQDSAAAAAINAHIAFLTGGPLPTTIPQHVAAGLGGPGLSGLPPHMSAIRSTGGPMVGSSTDVGMSADWMHQEAAARQLTHHIVGAESVWALVDIYNSNKGLMDTIHLTACITRLSKVLGSRQSASGAVQAAAEQLLPEIGRQLTPMLPNCNARGLANVLWGFGRLRMRPEGKSLVVLLQQFMRHILEATSRDCAVVLWSLARLSEAQAGAGVPRELLQQIGAVLLQHLCSFSNPRGSAPTSPGPMDAAPPADPDADPGPASGNAAAPEAAAADAALGAAQAAPALAASSQPVDAGSPGAAGYAAAVAAGAPLLLTVPTPRDISNSLMALSRLGFKPASVQAVAAAAAAAASAMEELPAAASPTRSEDDAGAGTAGGAADRGAADGGEPAVESEAVAANAAVAAAAEEAVTPAAEEAAPDAAAAAAAKAADETALGTEGAAAQAGAEALAPAPGAGEAPTAPGPAPASSGGAAGSAPGSPAAGTQEEGAAAGCPSGAAAAEGTGPCLPDLLLPRHQLEILAHCLLSQATTAKALDLQEAATALLNIGLSALSEQLSASGPQGDAPASMASLSLQGAAAAATAGAGGAQHGEQGAAPAQGQPGGAGGGPPAGQAARGAAAAAAAGGLPGAMAGSQQRRSSGGSLPGGGAGGGTTALRQAQGQQHYILLQQLQQQQQQQQQLQMQQQQQQQQMQLYGQQQAALQYGSLQGGRRTAQQAASRRAAQQQRQQQQQQQQQQQYAQAMRSAAQLQYVQQPLYAGAGGMIMDGTLGGTAVQAHPQQYATLQYTQQQQPQQVVAGGVGGLQVQSLGGGVGMVDPGANAIMLQQLSTVPANSGMPSGASGQYAGQQQYHLAAASADLQLAGAYVVAGGGTAAQYGAGGGTAAQYGAGAGGTPHYGYSQLGGVGGGGATLYGVPAAQQAQHLGGVAGGTLQYLQAPRAAAAPQQQQGAVGGQQPGLVYQYVQYQQQPGAHAAYGLASGVQLQQHHQQVPQQQQQAPQQQMWQQQQQQAAGTMQISDPSMVAFEPPGLMNNAAGGAYYY